MSFFVVVVFFFFIIPLDIKSYEFACELLTETTGHLFLEEMLMNISQFTDVFHLHVNSESKLSISLIVLSERPVGGKPNSLCNHCRPEDFLDTRTK